MSVRAVVIDPDASSGWRWGQVEEPVPGPGRVVVAPRHVSLNRGDLNDARSGRLPAGAVLGSDLAGVVIRAATDGQGPAAGARVVALASGAFAQRVGVDVDALAVVPDGVDLADAAALPVAGVAAVQALRAGLLDTRLKAARVLITGASGGVGRFAVQLAAYGGAHVIAVASDGRREGELVALGADQVVTDLGQVDEPVDLVLDSVGGRQLVAAWSLVTAGGSVQCVGCSSGEPAVFAPYAMVGPAKSLHSFLITGPVGPDLATLVRLVERADLRVHIGWRGRWARFGEAVEALTGRRISGKAVLDLPAR
jgi:NADPH:quinone reductase-like Zn-dependent oxidoreductase